MEDKYEIAIVGEEKDPSRILAITKENVAEKIAVRQSIIRSFAIEHPRETLIFAVTETKKQLIALHKKAGLDLDESDIPDVVFIDSKMKAKLAKAMKPYGGFDASEEQARSSVFDGVSIVFINKGLTDLEYARIIFHEMFHSIGKNVIAANRQSAKYGRQGYQVFGMKSPYEPWLLEEGLMAFESARFLDTLADNSLYKEDIEERAWAVNGLEQKRTIIDGRVMFADGRNIEPGYCLLRRHRVLLAIQDFSVRQNEGFAGSLFELIAGGFQGDEQEKFLNTALAARRDPRLIKELAGLIDSRWGKGTYTKILKCPSKDEAVWDLICELNPARAAEKRQPLHIRLIAALGHLRQKSNPN